MAISPLSLVSHNQATSAAVAQTAAQHRHGRHQKSISDVDALTSSAAAAPPATGKSGGKVDVTA
jgi:hypothetical protein